MRQQNQIDRQVRHLSAGRVMGAGVASMVLTVGVARFAYTPLLPLMESQAHLSQIAGGWLATVNYMGYMTGTLIAAMIVQPRLKFMLYRLALLLAIATTAATGLTHDVYLWAALRFVAGLSSVGGSLLGSGLVLNWMVRHGRRQELGIHFTGMGIGIALSGAAVLLMTGSLDWSQQWLALGVVGAALLVPAWGWMPEPAQAGPVQRAALQAQRAPSSRWGAALTAAYFCAGYGYVVSATFIVAMVARLPSLAHLGSAVWILVGLVAVPSCFGWDRLARNIGDTRALLLAFAVQTVGILLPCLNGSAAAWVLSAALYGATVVGIVSLTLAIAGRQYPENASRAMAKLTLAYGVAQVLAPIVSAYLTKAEGSYRGALLLTALVMACGTAVVLGLALYGGGRGTVPAPAALRATLE